MFRRISHWVRIKGNDALESRRLDHYKAIRITRELLGIVNELIGRPFCSREELEERSAGEPVYTPHAASQNQTKEAAPVVIYFDDRNARAVSRVEELLKGRNIPFQSLDVSQDEVTRSWALLQAKKEELPVVFVAGVALGGLAELAELDLNGGLVERVFGAARPPAT